MTLSPACNCLTPREREVVACVVAGQQDKQTARVLGISPRTVETYRTRIRERLGAHNTADIVRIALRGE